MPDKKYFLTLGGSFLLGACVLLATALIAFLAYPYLAPYLLPMLTGLTSVIRTILLVAVVVFIVFLFVYISTILGIIIRYIFKSAEVSKKAKEYTIAGVKEAGTREKGESKKKNK